MNLSEGKIIFTSDALNATVYGTCKDCDDFEMIQNFSLQFEEIVAL
jgi:hypothetical protein